MDCVGSKLHARTVSQRHDATACHGDRLPRGVYQFASPRDDENTGSGLAPLTLACISGNVQVVRDLIRSHGVNMNVRVLVDDLNTDFGCERGNGALGMAAFSCPYQHVHEIVSILLESGADPNARTHVSGGTPLMGAVIGQSVEAVRAWLACERLDLEIGLKINNAAALNIAGVKGTYAILEALLCAGADRLHRNDNGGFLLTDIAHNPISDPTWFELACATSMEDINAVRRPRNLKWKTTGFVMRTIFRLRISRSDLVMDQAHVNGCTPLSCAARVGNVKVVRWLLNNGTLKPLHSKTKNGRSPLDLSRMFGPHREVSLCYRASVCKRSPPLSSCSFAGGG